MWPAGGRRGVAAGVRRRLGGVVFKVKTANGMIVLVNLPKDAEVLVDGAEVAVAWPGGGKPAVITVTAGKHKVMVKKDGIEISDDEVTVQADGKEKFSVRFVASTKPSHELPKDDGADSTRTARKDVRSDAGPAVKTPSSQDSITNSIGMTLKLIPAGEFMMGSPDNDKDAENRREAPASGADQQVVLPGRLRSDPGSIQGGDGKQSKLLLTKW